MTMIQLIFILLDPRIYSNGFPIDLLRAGIEISPRSSNHLPYFYSYDRNHHEGPHKWSEQHQDCGHSQQSPVNIRTASCISHSFIKPLRYEHSNKDPIKVTIENYGHSVKWHLEYNDTRPYLIGGPLHNRFYFEAMHIHWGTKKSPGSEHFIDGKAGDLELHLVHRNEKYASYDEAHGYSDGLVAIGIISKASKYVARNEMYKNIRDVRSPGASVIIDGRPKGYNLRRIVGFLPSAPFLMYQGSLTAPPCSEATLWIVSREIDRINYRDVSSKDIILFYSGF